MKRFPQKHSLSYFSWEYVFLLRLHVYVCLCPKISRVFPGILTPPWHSWRFRHMLPHGLSEGDLESIARPQSTRFVLIGVRACVSTATAERTAVSVVMQSPDDVTWRRPSIPFHSYFLLIFSLAVPVSLFIVSIFFLSAHLLGIPPFACVSFSLFLSVTPLLVVLVTVPVCCGQWASFLLLLNGCLVKPTYTS